MFSASQSYPQTLRLNLATNHHHQTPLLPLPASIPTQHFQYHTTRWFSSPLFSSKSVFYYRRSCFFCVHSSVLLPFFPAQYHIIPARPLSRQFQLGRPTRHLPWFGERNSGWHIVWTQGRAMISFRVEQHSESRYRPLHLSRGNDDTGAFDGNADSQWEQHYDHHHDHLLRSGHSAHVDAKQSICVGGILHELSHRVNSPNSLSSVGLSASNIFTGPGLQLPSATIPSPKGVWLHQWCVNRGWDGDLERHHHRCQYHHFIPPHKSAPRTICLWSVGVPPCFRRRCQHNIWRQKRRFIQARCPRSRSGFSSYNCRPWSAVPCLPRETGLCLRPVDPVASRWRVQFYRLYRSPGGRITPGWHHKGRTDLDCRRTREDSPEVVYGSLLCFQIEKWRPASTSSQSVEW